MLLDTNILVAYLNDDTSVVESVKNWFSQGTVLFVSAVSYAEVLALPEASSTDLDKMRDFLEYFVVIDVNKDVAETTALLKRKYKLRFPDAAIAATAYRTRVPLVTRDKQFRKVDEITVLAI